MYEIVTVFYFEIYNRKFIFVLEATFLSLERPFFPKFLSFFSLVMFYPDVDHGSFEIKLSVTLTAVTLVFDLANSHHDDAYLCF